MDAYTAAVSIVAGASTVGLITSLAWSASQRRIRHEYADAERRRMSETQRLVAVTLSEALRPFEAQVSRQPTAPSPSPPSVGSPAVVSPAAAAPDANGGLPDRQVIAELAHSLRTPLVAARHEADAIALTYPDRSGLVEQARNIEGFVDLCDTILATFRQLVDTARRTERLRSGSLTEVVERLHAAAESKHGRGTTLACTTLPAQIPGYGASYLATLLLPLIENAVEASPSGGKIQIDYLDDTDHFFLIVTNVVADPPEGLLFPPDGTSSKHPGLGLGLPVARRVADMRRGGRVETSASDNTAVVRVRLPRERAR